MGQGPLVRRSVPDLVFAQLCEAILRGQYAPGERLPPQRALAAEFEVNMASIREALGRLEQLRLVEVRHGDATRVLDWRRSGGLEALALRGSIDPDLIAPLFEARRLLLVESARLAAQRRTDHHVEELEQLLVAMATARDDDIALLVDWAFMSTVISAAGNLVFELIMNSVREVYLPNSGSFVAVVQGREDLLELYRSVARAIAQRDADGAAAAIAELAGQQESRMRE